MFRRTQEILEQVREWNFNRRTCIVKIDHPRMKIKGRKFVNVMGDHAIPELRTYYAFFGIPYAQPPLGELRFMPPRPLAETVGRTPLVPGDKSHPCTQVTKCRGQLIGSEDCLYLNIYILRKPRMFRIRPVLVYFHGGDFQYGSGDFVNVQPDAIIRQDLIFVTVNYRLNIFGFLNMEVPKCTGNAGLKDQSAALQWIKANIDRFGGDPNNVTITGHGAGATCVNLHLLSSFSRGLFHKAIVMAGGLIDCPWGYQGGDMKMWRISQKKYQMENVLRYVLTLYFRTESVERLQTLGRTLGQQLQLEAERLRVFCGPSQEQATYNPFIPGIIELGKRCATPVPLMVGISAQEGNRFILNTGYRYMLERNVDSIDGLVKNDDDFATFLRENFRWSDESARSHMGTIREWYFPNLETMASLDIEDRLASLNTDIWFRRFYDGFKLGPTRQPPEKFFVYKFNYLSMNDNERPVYNGDKVFLIQGPNHGDEDTYLYNAPYMKKLSGGRFPPRMKHVIDHMCSMWGNFCRTGIPTSDEERIYWRAHTERRPRHLNICGRSTLVRRRLFHDRWQRLNDLVDRVPVDGSILKKPFVDSIFSIQFDHFGGSENRRPELPGTTRT